MAKVILEDNEKEVIKAAYKYFKKEHKHPLPSVIKEEQQEEVITEGLKYFKTSTRLYKLALKLEKRAKKNPQMLEAAKKVNALANKFEYIEDLYETGKKEEAKAQYKDLCNKYIDIIKLLKKTEVKDALRAAGSLSITVASMCVPYLAMQRFFPNLALTAINGAAGETISGMKRVKLYLERAGAFTLCGIPIKAARAALNYGSQETEIKTLKSVDRMLRDRDQEHSIYDDENGNPEMQLT